MSSERNIKTPNGGRTVTLNDIKFDVISGYSPSWTREYGDGFTTWDGRIIKRCKGIRFSLEFSTYGLMPEEVKNLSDILKCKEITLVCEEFGGTVYCDNISANLKNANFYGDFSNATVKLTAVYLIAADDDDSGSL